MEDYYDGVQGARRLLNELDLFLQDVTQNVGRLETLVCSIELQVTGGSQVSLERTYRRASIDAELVPSSKPTAIGS